jgi:hypothetical protein
MIECRSTDLEIYVLKSVMFYQMLEIGDWGSKQLRGSLCGVWPLSFDLFFASSIGFPVAQRTDSAAP